VRVVAILALCSALAGASAQGTKARATKSPAATKSQAATKAPGTKAPGTAANATPTQTKGGPSLAQRRPALVVAPETAPTTNIPVIMREVYDYDAGGRRDPFVSLLSTTELRPTVSDLRLVGVLYDESRRRPVAIMRDLSTNTQYRVTTGMTLGRMRVFSINRRSVIFTIEEFGLNRQDSLVLGDTSKVRAR